MIRCLEILTSLNRSPPATQQSDYLGKNQWEWLDFAPNVDISPFPLEQSFSFRKLLLKQTQN